MNIGAGYPLVVGGKPPGAFPSMVPIMFELGILLCGFATLFGCSDSSSLPDAQPPDFRVGPVRGRDGRQVLHLDRGGDKKFDLERTKALLEATNPTYLELVEEEVL